MRFEKKVEAESSSKLDGAAQPRNRLHVDPQIVNELFPVFTAAVVLLSALTTAAIYWYIGFSAEGYHVPMPGVAILAALLTFVVVKHRQASHAHAKSRKSRFPHVIEAVSAISIAFLILAVVLALSGAIDHYPPDLLVTWALSGVVIASLALMACDGCLKRLGVDIHGLRRVAVYGTGPLTYEVAHALAESEPGITVTTILDDSFAPPQPLEKGQEAHMDELVSKARDGLLDGVLIALPLTEEDRIRRLTGLLAAYPVDVEIVAKAPYLPPPIENVSINGDLMRLHVQHQPIGAPGIVAKTAIDFLLAGLGVVFLSPLMLLIALAIKLDSKGPVFFVQPRGGYRQKPIRVIKFRSMTTLETGDNIVQATRNDPRITRVGSFLRKTSLDELPQLFNVLRGELSLVGPRPHALAHDRYYGSIIESYPNRLKIKPGITGWAQVNGLRSETGDPELMRKRVQFDLYYINHWSLWLDFVILMRTVYIVFRDRSAY